MTWQDNLFNNLLVVGILSAIIVIIYLRVTNKTLTEFVKDIREMFSTPEE